MPANLTDRELVLLLKQGDQTAFESLYNRYKYPLYIKLLKFVKAKAFAEDLLHDLFTKIWDYRDGLDPDKSFQAYSYRIAENLVIDFFRKAALDERFRQQFLAQATPSYSHIEEILTRKEQKKLIETVLDLLSPQCREVFRLCKMEGRSYDEVANMLEISPHTISNHLVKANKLIRSYLAKEKDLALLILFVWFLS